MKRHDPCEGMPVSRSDAFRSRFEDIMFDIIFCEAMRHVFD